MANPKPKPTPPRKQVPQSRDEQKRAGLIAATSRSIHGNVVRKDGK